MGISLNPDHLKRYKDIAALFFKYGRSDLVKSAGLEDAILLDEEEHSETAIAPNANELAVKAMLAVPQFTAEPSERHRSTAPPSERPSS